MNIIGFIVIGMLAASTSANLFFDYGILRGDDIMVEEDDECAQVNLDSPLRFYGNDYTEIYVGNLL